MCIFPLACLLAFLPSFLPFLVCVSDEGKTSWFNLESKESCRETTERWGSPAEKPSMAKPLLLTEKAGGLSECFNVPAGLLLSMETVGHIKSSHSNTVSILSQPCRWTLSASDLQTVIPRIPLACQEGLFRPVIKLIWKTRSLQTLCCVCFSPLLYDI